MNKNYSFLRIVAAVILMAVSSCVLTSCQKDNISPIVSDTEDPSQPIVCEAWVTFNDVATNYSQQGRISPYAIDGGVARQLLVNFGEKVFVSIVYNDFEGDSITMTQNTFELGNVNSFSGIYGGYDQTSTPIVQYPFTKNSEVTFVKLGNGQYRIYGSGQVATRQGFKNIEFHIEGGLYE